MRTFLFIVLIFLVSLVVVLNSCYVKKNQMTRSEVDIWCNDYVNNKQIMKPDDTMTDKELYEQCMEIYGYGKNN